MTRWRQLTVVCGGLALPACGLLFDPSELSVGGASSAADASGDTAAPAIDGGNEPPACGVDGRSCELGSVCVARNCVIPTSCKVIHEAVPRAPSGTYALAPEIGGDGGALAVDCDMTTAGGGWTLVFQPTSLAYDTSTLDYTRPISLVAAATEALIAYRDATSAIVGSTAVFPVPEPWKSLSPFQDSGADLTTTVTIDGAPATTKMLRYGIGGFSGSAICAADWNNVVRSGRLCIVDTPAPFFNGFAITGGDYCPTSAEGAHGTACSVERQLTIAVR